MRKPQRYLILIIIVIMFATAGAVLFQFKNKFGPAPLPPALPYNMIATQTQTQAQTPAPATSNPVLPAEINLNVPFTLQAPNQNWDSPYQQFCEEASVLMAASYINNQPILSPKDADTKLLAIRDFEVKKFGYYEDTNAEETAVIFREYYNLKKVEIVSNPTAADIKSALAEGRVVVVPLAGRQIGNPYYQQPGPLYHMLVIKGYKKNGDFITNDPGTRHGADFIYKTDTIMNAIHDWNGGNVDTGKRVIIIVG